MLRRLLPLLVLTLGLAVPVACDSGEGTAPDGDGIHPQPQPVTDPQKFDAPCTAEACGAPPATMTSPSCRVSGDACAWTEASDSVSYRACPESECGAPPTGNVCPASSASHYNSCGSENDAACTWTTACAPPRSNTPCPRADGCGPMPAIGVLCDDAGTAGTLECMEFVSGCAFQAACP